MNCVCLRPSRPGRGTAIFVCLRRANGANRSPNPSKEISFRHALGPGRPCPAKWRESADRPAAWFEIPWAPPTFCKEITCRSHAQNQACYEPCLILF